ncbi:serine hydrolase [Streptomyces sp. NPDC085524]|uniref:serine hydrolase n=1 Tax=Streptomyces sp. NPDC085524 TaxID=3365728 RepID=UPI0037D00EC7
MTTASGRDLVATAGVAAADTDNPAPQDGYFRIASTGKALMATVVLQLTDEGKLSLDDTVDRRLPAVIDGNGNDGRKMTVRLLLSNTSGLHDDLPASTPRRSTTSTATTPTPPSRSSPGRWSTARTSSPARAGAIPTPATCSSA